MSEPIPRPIRSEALRGELGGGQDSAKRSSRTEGSPSSTVGDHEPPAAPAELVRRPSDLLVSRIVASVMRRYPIWHMKNDLHSAYLECKKMEADVRALLDGSAPTAGVPFRDNSDTEPFDPDLPPDELTRELGGGQAEKPQESGRSQGPADRPVPATPCKHCGHDAGLHGMLGEHPCWAVELNGNYCGACPGFELRWEGGDDE